MPKKTTDLGQRRKKGADKRRRTYELYGKMKPTRPGDVRVHTTSVRTTSSNAKNTKKNTKKR